MNNNLHIFASGSRRPRPGRRLVKLTLLAGAVCAVAAGVNCRASIELLDDPGNGFGSISGYDWGRGHTSILVMPHPKETCFELIHSGYSSALDLEPPDQSEDSQADKSYHMARTDWLTPFTIYREMSVAAKWGLSTEPEFAAAGAMGAPGSYQSVYLNNRAVKTEVGQVNDLFHEYTLTHLAGEYELWSANYVEQRVVAGQHPQALITMSGPSMGGVHTVSASADTEEPTIRYVPVPPVTLAFVGGEIPPDGANLEPLAGGPISSYKDTFNAPVVARAYL